MADNELIAKFMGYRKIEGSHLYRDPDSTVYVSDARDFAYHCRWDWLMPVVYKILITWIPENGQWPYEYTVLQKMLLGSGIKQVYACVVEFIKWYNKQNEN